MSPPRHVLKCKREARLSVSYGRDISSRDRAVPSCLISRNSGWSVSDRVDLDSLRQYSFHCVSFPSFKTIHQSYLHTASTLRSARSTRTRFDYGWKRVYFLFLRSAYRSSRRGMKKRKNRISTEIKGKTRPSRHGGRNNAVVRSAERVIRIFPPNVASIHGTTLSLGHVSRFLFPSFFSHSSFAPCRVHRR